MKEDLDNRNLAPFTLVCIFVQSWKEEEREKYHVIAQKFDKLRYDAHAINDLEQQGMILWDWEKMEIELTPKGLKMAKVLVNEIMER